MKSLSYLFAAALLLSASPLIAMDPPVVDDADRQPLPKFAGKVFAEFLAVSDNPFDAEDVNGDPEFMTGRHNLQGKMTFDDWTINRFAAKTKGINFNNYEFELEYSSTGIHGKLVHIPGRPKGEVDEKLNLDLLPRIVFEAKSQPVVEEESMEVDPPKDGVLILGNKKYHPDALLRYKEEIISLNVSRAKNCPKIDGCTNLEELILGVNGDDFKYPYFANLKYLDISHASKIPDVESILSNCPNLQVVDISHSKIEYGKIGGTQLKDVMMKFSKNNIEVVYEN